MGTWGIVTNVTSPTCLALKSTSVVCSWRTIAAFSVIDDEAAAAANGSSNGDVVVVVVVVSRMSILVTECILNFCFDSNLNFLYLLSVQNQNVNNKPWRPQV